MVGAVECLDSLDYSYLNDRSRMTFGASSSRFYENITC